MKNISFKGYETTTIIKNGKEIIAKHPTNCNTDCKRISRISLIEPSAIRKAIQTPEDGIHITLGDGLTVLHDYHTLTVTYDEKIENELIRHIWSVKNNIDQNKKTTFYMHNSYLDLLDLVDNFFNNLKHAK